MANIHSLIENKMARQLSPNTIKKFKPHLVIEIEQRHLAYDMSKTLDYIKCIGYEIFFINNVTNDIVVIHNNNTTPNNNKINNVINNAYGGNPSFFFGGGTASAVCAGESQTMAPNALLKSDLLHFHGQTVRANPT